MQNIITLLFKAIRLIWRLIGNTIDRARVWMLLYGNNIQFKGFHSHGIPYISIARGGTCVIGNNFKMNNGLKGNPIGRPQPCTFVVDRNARLEIGSNVGISSTAIVAHSYVKIGNHVKIGGGVCIYDTDFHSLDAHERSDEQLDRSYEKKSPVIIEDYAFIGAHSTILKGVTIGKNSIIGACSVVTKSIPPNEIWAGNPARFIKSL